MVDNLIVDFLMFLLSSEGQVRRDLLIQPLVHPQNNDLWWQPPPQSSAMRQVSAISFSMIRSYHLGDIDKTETGNKKCGLPFEIKMVYPGIGKINIKMDLQIKVVQIQIYNFKSWVWD